MSLMLVFERPRQEISKSEANSCYMSLEKRKRHIIIDICMGYHGMV